MREKVDSGEDFITPEFLNILFFQQKNLVIFPYVDLKHLHALEIFTAGHTSIDLESTALHDLRNILEFESSNSYSHSPTFYFIYNLDGDKVKEILVIDNIRCVLNSNEIIPELANGSKFVFYNKKNNQFVNYTENDSSLEFEQHLISSSQNITILQDKIQSIKNVASKIFTEVNQNSSSSRLPELLKGFEQKFWQKILDFTSRYFGVNIPPASQLKSDSYEPPSIGSRKDFKDFSNEYALIVSTNKMIGKEFIQQLHEFRSKRVNPEHLELEELFNPLKLYNYLRNRHWKEGIPQRFIDKWLQMSISQYTLADSDMDDLEMIFTKLGIRQDTTPLPTSEPLSSNSEPARVTNPLQLTSSDQTLVGYEMPSLQNWAQFKKWIISQIGDIEKIIDRLLSQGIKKEFLTTLHNDISNLEQLMAIKPQLEKVQEKKSKNYLIIDITNILNEDKDVNGKLKVNNILKVRDAVLSLGYTPGMIADASMRYHVDNSTHYDELKKKGMVKDAPAGKEADEFVLAIAKKENCKFLSNDMYNNYKKEFGQEWVFQNRLTCKFFNGSFIIR